MSTDAGDAKVVREFVNDAKQQLAAAAAREEQLNLIEPVTAEDIWEAREALGPDAGRLAVVQEARSRKRGRPPGAANKRTDDFKRYLLSFGQHPALTLMQLQATAPEVLIEASKHEKVHSFQKNGTPNIVLEHMTYDAAQSLRVRCAEALMPYLESKKPVAVDMTFTGVADLVIEGVTHSRDEIGALIEDDFLPVDGSRDDG